MIKHESRRVPSSTLIVTKSCSTKNNAPCSTKTHFLVSVHTAPEDDSNMLARTRTEKLPTVEQRPISGGNGGLRQARRGGPCRQRRGGRVASRASQTERPFLRAARAGGGGIRSTRNAWAAVARGLSVDVCPDRRGMRNWELGPSRGGRRGRGVCWGVCAFVAWICV